MANLPVEAIRYYFNHAYEFVLDHITGPASKKLDKNVNPTLQQKEVLDTISRNDMVVVKAGHGPGKTTVFAWVLIWFLKTRPPKCRIPCTAPTENQLTTVLWPEVNRWLSMSNFASEFTWTKERVECNINPEEKFAVIRTSNRSENMAGNHATHLLWIIDECFGIDDPMNFEVIEGSLTEEDNKILMGGNPTVVTGFCYDAFNKNKDLWKNITMNAEESPIVKQSHIQNMQKKYGRHSDIYRVRVLGEFPSGNPESFITLEQVRNAMQNNVEPSGVLEMGVDVARGGADRSIISTKCGGHFFPLKKIDKNDIPGLYMEVLQELRKYRLITKYKGRVKIKVDDTGVGGGVTDLLNRNQNDNIEVVGINFGGSGNEFYSNMTVIMWAELRDALPNSQLPNDDELLESLTSRLIDPEPDKKGRIKLESKNKQKIRIQRSPDEADAVILANTNLGIIDRAWPNYQTTNGEHHRDFKPANETNRYVSLFQDKDMGIYGICTIFIQSHLYIYKEILILNPTPEEVAFEVEKKAKNAQIYGNHRMFMEGENTAHLLRGKLVLRPNQRYDEAGSILLTNKMFQKNKITVHSDCEETDRQFRDWGYKNGRPDRNEFGLCYALCNLVSVLRNRMIDLPELPPGAYTKERTRVREHFRQGNVPQKSKEHGYRWMI